MRKRTRRRSMKAKKKGEAKRDSGRQRAADKALEILNAKRREEYETAQLARTERLRRQLRGPCPRCDPTDLIVYGAYEEYEPEDIVRYGFVEPNEPGYVTQVGRIIYCPNCGALNEIGGETHYPQSGKTGLPQEKADEVM